MIEMTNSLGAAYQILTVAQAYAADLYAAKHGVASRTLMENAGRAVADEIVRRWPVCSTAVLCGPGNNGGDGFVVARLLAERGWPVRVALLVGRDRLKGDAAAAAARWPGEISPLGPDFLHDAPLVVDALFGAGLARPLEGAARDVAIALNASKVSVAAVDVPSGLHGDLGRPLECKEGIAVQAELTVTFFRKKSAHVLMPGRLLCGDVIVADIGIPAAALETIQPRIFENTPALWGRRFPWPQPLGHKYGRGHAVVVSGPAHATGAARMAARGALRAGAGLVSVASPPDAVPVNAASLTAIMVKPFAGAAGLSHLLEDARLNAVVIGPGCGTGRPTQELVAAVLAGKAAAVLDADALTSFAGDPGNLFRQLRERAVLTPHAGEFARVFPGVLDRAPSRIEAARVAAAAAGCTVLLKGPDTVVAAADGRVAVNTNAPPTLATAGAGDVLSGIIGGLLAQGLDSFSAASAGAWLHGEAAARFGYGLIAEDIAEQLPAVLTALKDGPG
ncbi:MAG TPA: NAD(P)H-hydrate dehydratase [Rhizomicrobium sp.]|jgi:NAD(P)H-hydrate epimerase|nr:NAD(P)H-hydrate dehydratase [Rhizomicrobium sp.]